MDDKTIKQALENIKKDSKKRNFNQKVDAIFVLKDLDLKRAEHQVDFFTSLHFSNGKDVKICAFAAPELMEEAQKVCDFVIAQSDFKKYQDDKKLLKKLVKEYDYFIAQANIMPQVAQVFGKVLGPKGKMPNPKAGCVVPPKATLKPIYERLQKTIRLQAKTQPIVQITVGNQEQNEKEVIDNIKTAYSQLVHHLPSEQNNIKTAFLKYTMGKPVKIE
ncbi:50S ribosomal protein L1 [Candidatus Woesearchaeota archaeon]|nr:50S ribosomal protein L1 [Candidatus Woesearchaeota archaeon]